MELTKLKNKITKYPKNEILLEWENEIIIALYKDSSLFLDSELFELMNVKTKIDVLKVIDFLIKKVKEGI